MMVVFWFRQFTIRDDAAHIAVIRYNEEVDVASEIKLNSAENFEQFQEKYERILYDGHGNLMLLLSFIKHKNIKTTKYKVA